MAQQGPSPAVAPTIALDTIIGPLGLSVDDSFTAYDETPPAGGTPHITWTTQDGAYALLVSVEAVCITDGGPGPRTVFLQPTTTGVSFNPQWTALASPAASSAVAFAFGTNINAASQGANAGYVPIPPVLLPPATAILLAVNGGAGGDEWISIHTVCRYFQFGGDPRWATPVPLPTPVAV
jgi:hypothetical protein